MSETSPTRRPRTYGDLRTWSDGFQLEIYFGARGCRVFVAPFDIRLPRSNEPDDAIENVVQPDISVICDASKLDARGCRGAPDFVIEILSPSTAARDHFIKRALYEQHGVREYWLVHPLDRIVTIYRRAGERGFADVTAEP